MVSCYQHPLMYIKYFNKLIFSQLQKFIECLVLKYNLEINKEADCIVLTLHKNLEKSKNRSDRVDLIKRVWDPNRIKLVI